MTEDFKMTTAADPRTSDRHLIMTVSTDGPDDIQINWKALIEKEFSLSGRLLAALWTVNQIADRMKARGISNDIFLLPEHRAIFDQVNDEILANEIGHECRSDETPAEEIDRLFDELDEIVIDEIVDSTDSLVLLRSSSPDTETSFDIRHRARAERAPLQEAINSQTLVDLEGDSVELTPDEKEELKELVDRNELAEIKKE